MTQIPNYIITEEVDSDSIATTYTAKSQKLNDRLVILKIIHADIAKSNTFRKHFLAIGKHIAQLDHPYLVAMYEINTTDIANITDAHIDDIDLALTHGKNQTLSYIAMEHKQESLRDKLQHEKLSIHSILAIIKRVATALSYVHQHGFVHGNINPDTILFDHDDKAKLADSGFVELLEHVSNDLELQGTLHYMSPEQSTMTTLDHRSDIYSLGLVLYEMLVTEKAFVAETTAQAIYQHTMVCPADLPTTYSYLQPVLDKALAKSPRDRYATAQEMLDALETTVDTEYFHPIEHQKKRKNAKKSWLLSSVVIAGILVGLASLIGFGVLNEKQNTLNQLAITTLPNTDETNNTSAKPVAVTLFDNQPIPPKKTTAISEPITSATKPNGNEQNNQNEQFNNNDSLSVDNDNANAIGNTETNNNENDSDKSLLNNTNNNDANNTNAPEPNPIVDAIPISKVSINIEAEKDKKPLASRIIITSKPNNEVIVDGKNLQKKQFELEAGEYDVSIEKTGYITQSKQLTITDAPHEDVVFRLKPTILIGDLKLAALSKKEGKALQANYEVRGLDSDYYKKRTKRTSARFKLPSGRYAITVSYQDKTIKKQIRIKKDETLNEKIAFTVSPAVITKSQEDKNTKKDKKNKQEEEKKKEKQAKQNKQEEKKSAQNQEKQDKSVKTQLQTQDNIPNKRKNDVAVALSRIYITAKLGNEWGKNLQAKFYLYQNNKIVKTTVSKKEVQFQVPPGEYMIKVVYQGISSQARAMLKKGEVIEQTFVYDNLPLPADKI